MTPYILVVDDEPAVRELVASQLDFLGFSARPTIDHKAALELAASEEPPALALLDIEMPEISGVDLLRQIKSTDPDIQVVMISGLQDLATVRECLRAGAYDYLSKPFDLEDLANTTERALERRRLVRENREYQADLERMVQVQTDEIRSTRDMALTTLARLAESRDSETGLHLERMQEYSRILARAIAREGSPYADQVDDELIEWIFKSAPLHDIGKVGIPDAILRKPGPLTPEEQAIMRTHTTIGGDTLRSVLEQFHGTTFLTMAMEIAYHHHERWDGRGYPHGLSTTDIPLPARIVALADAYDAITSRRPYKEPVDHQEAIRRVTIDRGRHFDPVLVDAFLECSDRFETVRRSLEGRQDSRRQDTDSQTLVVTPSGSAGIPGASTA